jgi:asparagine synthase (glutamine-hydrolysing)
LKYFPVGIEGRFLTLCKLARQPGIKWLAQRGLYALHLRVGAVQRRTPRCSWDRKPLHSFLSNGRLADPEIYLEHRRTSAPPFLFAPADREVMTQALEERGLKPESAMTRVENLAAGKVRYFHHLDLQTGFPPAWHLNPLTGTELPADQHWSAMDDFRWGDIKFVWEPSRFPFACDLVRAHWHTGDERFAELFWQAVEDWRVQNPPQSGANWKCGQEIALRIMAWCFGLYGLLDCGPSTGRRVAELAQMIAVSAERIEANIDYALSQRNNHGVSEAAGLFTVGALFPEFQQSSRWLEQGRVLLERLGVDLIYDDGSFVQHSFNYHRLMLHVYIWAMKLGELCGRPFSDDLYGRIERAVSFLRRHLDPCSGRVPNYGANDGALVLPLNECDYLDYRPVVQAGAFLVHRHRILDDGPWDEDLLWLFGPESLRVPEASHVKSSFSADAGGYYTLVGGDSWGMVRCHTYRDRPSQADMLHFDLWYRGENILRDGGTHSYNCPAPFDRYFASTRAHNTVEVDGRDQMVRASRFLWLDWTQARVLENRRREDRDVHLWLGEHTGYRRPPLDVLHRRGILRAGDAWIVVDDLFSTSEHEYTLRWRLIDGRWRREDRDAWGDCKVGAHLHIAGSAPCSMELLQGQIDPVEGWESLHYGQKTPVPTVVCRSRGGNVRLVTSVSFGGQPVSAAVEGPVKIDGFSFHLSPISTPSASPFDLSGL